MYNFNIWHVFQKGRFIFNWIIIILLTPFIACAQLGIGVQPGEPSEIKPPALLLPDKEIIPLFGPVNLSVQSSEIRFEFDSSMTTYATLLIFETNPPKVDASGTYLSDISSCWGGATNMTTHTWNNALVLLGDATSAVHSCDPSNFSTPLSKTSIIYAGNMFSGQTYYWVVLGYDSEYKLTHSSPLYQFTR